MIKESRYAEIVVKIIMKKRIITGAVELIIQNTVEKCGGAV